MGKEPPAKKAKEQMKVNDPNHPEDFDLNLNSQNRCFSCLKDSRSVTLPSRYQSISGILDKLGLDSVAKEEAGQLVLEDGFDQDRGDEVEVKVKLCRECSKHYSELSKLFQNNSVEMEKIKEKLELIRGSIEAGNGAELKSFLPSSMGQKLSSRRTKTKSLRTDEMEHIVFVNKLRSLIKDKCECTVK